MARKVSGKVVVSQFHRTQKNGDVYVYERMLQYNPEKGYTVQVSSSKFPRHKENHRSDGHP